MSRTAVATGLAILILVGAGIAFVGWRVLSSSHEEVCQACKRPMHLINKTVALVDGDNQEEFCCPTCARTYARQTGHSVKIVELTDYVTRTSLDPAKAVLVEGSDVNPCVQHAHEMTREQDRQVMALDFDRCAPSVLAFGDAKLAEDFIATHGGAMVRLNAFMRQ